jgi:hypothetical protein
MKSLFDFRKHLSFLIALVLFQGIGNAQNYEFTHFSESYTEITDGTVLSNTTVWFDELPVTVPIGFTFPYFGFQVESIEIYQTVFHSEFIHDNSPIGIQIFPFGAQFTMANSGTEISYKTTGTVGSRIFVTQWKGLALMGDSIGNSRANFQAWFYEADGTIEFRFGDMLISSNQSYFTEQPGGFTALLYYTNPSNPEGSLSSSSLCLLDNAESPEMANYNSFIEPYTMNGYPAEGKVYRFTRTDAGISEHSAATFTITPNPGNDNILISTEHQFDKIAIYSMDGQLVLTTTMDAMSKQLNVQELAKGSYIIELNNHLTKQTQRFIKM